MRKILVSLVVLIVSATVWAQVHLSSQALNYLQQALTIIETNYYKKNSFDWNNFKIKVLNRASGARTPADTYAALRYAMELLNNKHAQFLAPNEIKKSDQYTFPAGKQVAPGIAYIALPSINADDQNIMVNYAERGQKQICDLAKSNPVGWIIDLRQNSGQALWPMLLALGPFLSGDKLGSFVGPSGKQSTWHYANGAVFLNDAVQLKIANYCNLDLRAAKVVVLIDDTTLSSAEAVTIGFVGRKNTLLLGTPTYGLVSGTEKYKLSDGALLIIPTVQFADRLGNIYDSGIMPNQFASGEQMIPQAIKWLAPASS